MKALYFYSKHDGEIRAACIKSNTQVVSIINHIPDECFLKFLMFKTSISNPEYLNECHNKICPRSIRLVLDAVGFFDTHVIDGAGLNHFLLKDPDNIRLIVAMAKEDKTIARYLSWAFGNYVSLFEDHYGELILIVSNRDDIRKLPLGYLPEKLGKDKRVFYSRYDSNVTKRICDACNLKIEKGEIISLFPSAVSIALGQLILQGIDFLGDLPKF